MSGDRVVHTTVSGDYPSGVPVKDMTPDQQIAYWRQRARQHEDRAGRWSDVDAVRARLAELEGPRLTSEQQQREEAENAEHDEQTRARTEQRRGQLALTIAAVTGRTGDDLAIITDRLNPDSFYDDEGQLDTDALERFTALQARTLR